MLSAEVPKQDFLSARPLKLQHSAECVGPVYVFFHVWKVLDEKELCAVNYGEKMKGLNIKNDHVRK